MYCTLAYFPNNFALDQIRRKFAVAHIRAGRILEQLKVNGIVK